MGDRLYFRQLLSGRDFARTDNVARQMDNFVYLIGDRETGEAVAVDPAYDIQGLLDILAADDMKLTGALATHFHPDHVGGSMGGYTISGVRELLTLHPVPIHVQADEPKDPGQRANWLPSPKNADFSLYVRGYWPDDAITRGQWTPPAVVKVR